MSDNRDSEKENKDNAFKDIEEFIKGGLPKDKTPLIMVAGHESPKSALSTVQSPEKVKEGKDIIVIDTMADAERYLKHMKEDLPKKVESVLDEDILHLKSRRSGMNELNQARLKNSFLAHKKEEAVIGNRRIESAKEKKRKKVKKKLVRRSRRKNRK